MSEIETPENEFRSRGIDFSPPGFCDDPQFARAEKEDRHFLATYAKYFEARS